MTNNKKYPANTFAKAPLMTLDGYDMMIATNHAEIEAMKHNIRMHEERILQLEAAKKERVRIIMQNFDSLAASREAERALALMYEPEPEAKKAKIIDGRIVRD